MENPSEQSVQSMDIGSRLGAFDNALKVTGMNILAKPGEGFTIHYPFGVVTVKSTREAIGKFIDLAEEYGVGQSNDESVLNSRTNRNALKQGGKVIWESERYASEEGTVTLKEWLSGANVTPIGIAQTGRLKVGQAIDRTGTNRS